jgi:hypothetical protein
VFDALPNSSADTLAKKSSHMATNIASFSGTVLLCVTLDLTGLGCNVSIPGPEVPRGAANLQAKQGKKQ